MQAANTPDELKIKLQQEFEILCYMDLADIGTQHRTVFDVFKLHRKDQFDHHHRLVFYSGHEPEQDFLNHIQRAASRIDISNVFVLIVCPFDLESKLQLANEKYGYDHMLMGHMRYNLINTKPLHAVYAKHDSLCPLPFLHLGITNQGNAAPCCKFQGTTGTLQNCTVRDLFHNDSIQAIRQQMIAGQRPEQCGLCWQNEDKGTKSLRLHALDKYGDRLDQAWLDDVQLRCMNFLASSLCNFKCRICHAGASTSIAIEEMRFGDQTRRRQIKQVIKTTTDDSWHSAMIDSLSEIPHLEELHVLGGETLMWPRLPDLINRLISLGLAEHLRLEINTNGSQFPEQLLHRMVSNFREVEILLSIDNTGERFELERGGTWSKVYHNIGRFSSLRAANVLVKLSPTVNIQNLLYLDDVLQIRNAIPLDGILWWYLEFPEELCIDHTTAHIKQIAYEKYHDHGEPELRAVAQRLVVSPPAPVDNFVHHMDRLDSRRGQSWRSTHPELAQAVARGA